MKKIKGNLILKEDTFFDEPIEVEGDIIGDYALTVKGDIDAWNIKARDIKAWNIDAWNIKARDIDARDIKARDIDAWDIDARDIICERRIKKRKDNKTIARVFIQNKSKLKVGEKMIKGGEE